MGGSRGGNRALRKLQRRFKPGYELVMTGNTKHAIRGPDGELVRQRSGMPVTLPNSPSWRGHETALERKLKDAGVID